MTEADCNNTSVEAHSDQAFNGYKDHVSAQVCVADQLYTVVGSLIAASEALITAAGWDRTDSRTDKEVAKHCKAFNAAEDEWVKSKRRFGFLLSYYSNADSNVPECWMGVSDAVDTYRECVSTWYERPDGTPKPICGDQKANIDKKLNGLGHALKESQTDLPPASNDPDEAGL